MTEPGCFIQIKEWHWVHPWPSLLQQRCK